MLTTPFKIIKSIASQYFVRNSSCDGNNSPTPEAYAVIKCLDINT